MLILEGPLSSSVQFAALEYVQAIKLLLVFVH